MLNSFMQFARRGGGRGAQLYIHMYQNNCVYFGSAANSSATTQHKGSQKVGHGEL